MTDLSKLAASGTRLDFALAEVKGDASVKTLRTRGPRKGETLSPANRGGGVGAATGGTAKGMVSDLDAVKDRYARVKAVENRQAAREEAALRRAEREALALAALDELLDEVDG